MELLLALAAFSLWQCRVWLPPESLVLVPWPGRPRAVCGGGWRVLHPWPGARAVAAAAPSFEATDEGVRATAPARRFAELLAPPSELPYEALADAAPAGCRVRVAGRRFLRTSSPAAASVLAEQLRALAAVAAPERPQHLAEQLRASLDAGDAREATARVRRTTRWLGRTCDLYALLLFGMAPLMLLRLDADHAWLRLLPILVGVHACAFVLLHRAHRRLHPTQRRERTELLIAAGLFPPALLRAPQDLLGAALRPFHPAAVAAVWLDRADLAALLRNALARLESRQDAEDRTTAALAVLARNGLLAIAAESGLAPEALRAPLARATPAGVRYCPICLEDFRPGFATCSECGSATVAYAPPAPSGS